MSEMEDYARVTRDLGLVKKFCENCQGCDLSKTRTNIVFGSGKASSKLMLIGEAPGKNEDEGGEPFIGAAGKVLDGLLEVACIKRSEVYIANVLKCRPPENRNPSQEEIVACAPYLAGQIRAILPMVIVTMGNFATQTVLGTTEPITSVRGQKHYTKNGRLVIPTFHPAAAIYDKTKLSFLTEDFKVIKYYLV